MNPLQNLRPASNIEVRKYLKFFRQKRDSALRSIDNEFSSISSNRLVDDVYSKEDVEDIVDFLQSSMRVSR
jgi:hypothetical protein